MGVVYRFACGVFSQLSHITHFDMVFLVIWLSVKDERESGKGPFQKVMPIASMGPLSLRQRNEKRQNSKSPLSLALRFFVF